MLSPNKAIKTSELAALMGAGDWTNPLWRLNNLYKGRDEDGKVFKFKMNDEQYDLLTHLWYRNNIVKARQLGMTTLICLVCADQAIWSSNFTATIIAQTLPNVIKIFDEKVKWPLANLPPGIQDYISSQTTISNQNEVKYSWGSSIYAGLSPRGGTNKILHVSEFAKICASNPEKAREIVTGGFASVHKGGHVFIESTAEGQDGKFYEITQEAKRAKLEERPLTPLDFKLHFYAWWGKKSYALEPEDAKNVSISPNEEKYFEELTVKHGVPTLSHGQKTWYVQTSKMLQGDMKREHPSYLDEAFEVALEGAIYKKQLELLYAQRRITDVPWDPALPVNTFWDFGAADLTTIWFHQRNGLSHQFFRCYANEGVGLDHYWKYCQDLGVTFGKHYLPHDADARMLGEKVETKRTILERLGMRNIKVVTRVPARRIGIELTRQRLPMAFFDRNNCKDGISAISAYQWEWDDRRATWKDEPFHNWASHYSDGLRVWAEGYEFKPVTTRSGPSLVRNNANWRTA